MFKFFLNSNNSKINNNIHIDKTAYIGKNVKIDPFVYIGPNVVIKDDVHISSFVSIGGLAEMPRKNPSSYSVEVEENVTIREFVTVHSGHTRNTILKKGVYIMNHSHIAHDCLIKNNSIISANVTLAGHVEIGEESFMGIESCAHQHTVVGDLTIVGSNSYAKGVLGPCLKYVGNPAKPIGINEVGIKNSKLSDEFLEILKKAATEYL